MGTRPNVLLLVTDQERYDVSASDGPEVRTSGYDRLRAEGMHFERAYTPSSICTSARASLLTGLYPHNHGMLNNCHGKEAVLRNLPEQFPTFARSLQAAGYETSYVGKWHVGRDQRPEHFGFDHYQGTDSNVLDDTLRAYHRSFGIDSDEIDLKDELYTDHSDDPDLISATLSIPIEATRTYYYTELTIDRLRRYADDDTPFLHRLDYPGPHHPYVVPEPYASMYDPEEIEPWSSYLETFDGKPRIHELQLANRGVRSFDWDDWAAIVSKYFGYVSFIADQVDRLLAALDELGLTDNTVVIHTSDHGDFTGSHRQFNKGPLMYEETYHVPLVVRWPDVVEPGSVCTEFVQLHDHMPTILDIVGLDAPSGIDGRSIRPLLEGTTPADWPQRVFAEYHGDEFGFYSQRMLASHRFKYVHNASDIDELYDHDSDPHELRNLIDHPEYESVRHCLQKELLEEMESTDDPFFEWTEKALT
ncbi:sulfatase-like hydrolase/transferase [Natronorubrum halophilum]|uniref:sulfatase-like hydrolase/transferase n=1 Tax=Natronorubrum halophilum TaxID=1702106 RepID=UPI0010C159C4|nr:sulfatase-like hydrolase/transferase [Natronorubrum halophilum]